MKGISKLLAVTVVVILAFACIACESLPLNSGFNSSTTSSHSTSSTSSSSSASSSNSSSHSTSSTANSTQTSTSSKNSSNNDIIGDETLIEVQLTNSNTPEEASLDGASFSTEIEGIEFDYNNVFINENNDSHVNLSKNGSIVSATTFGDLQYVILNYDFINASDSKEQNLYGFGYLKYRVGQNYVDNPNDKGTYLTTVGEDYTIDLSQTSNDYFISFWTPRTVQINSLTFYYSEADYQPVYENFTINLFSTNDIHGQVKSTSSYPGLPALTAKMQSLTGDYNIFIDQGDLYQGTAEAGLCNGLVMDDFLLVNGYESTTLGNHEFDWGEDRIQEHVNYSPVTILANNVRYKNNNQSPAWATPYKLISRNGVKIGIIGAVGNVASSISASMIENITFLTGSQLTQQIIRDSQTLKSMGADFIILSIHNGDSKESNNVSSLGYYDVSTLSKTHVDLVLEGHSHQSYAFYDSKGVWHLQNSGNGSTFYLSKLVCEYQNGEYSVSMSIANNTPYYYSSSGTTPDPILTEIDNWYSEHIYGNLQGEVIGMKVPYMYSSDFEDLTAKLYYEYGYAKTKDTQYEIVLGGGFIRTRTPYNLAGGTVVYGDVFNLLPFDNDLVLCSVTGSILKSNFLNTSNDDYHVYASIKSSQVSNNKIYYILTDSYTSDWAPNKLTVIQNYTPTDGKYARDLVADYFRLTYL